MEKITKGIVGMLVFTMVFIGFTTPFTYADLPSQWAEDTISQAISHELTTEKVLSDYQKPITREEFSEVAVNLYKALGGEVEEEIHENPFVDTNNPIILQAYNLGIINGKSGTIFAPDEPISRQELSVMLVRTIKAIDSEFQPVTKEDMFFLDMNEIATWAKEEIHYLFEQGIIKGVGALSIDPTGLTTREQAIVLTMRAYESYDRIIRQADALIVAQTSEARSLDPHATIDKPSYRVMGQIYETLVKQNENMEIEPGLAESWKHIDEQTIEFKLKEVVKFHNGEELTSEDVKFTFQRGIQAPSTGHILGKIDSNEIEIIDEYTIRISTTEPYTPILPYLAHVGASILNQKAVIESGDDYGNNPIGTGPFKFEMWQRGESIELSKFNDYHGEAANEDLIVFKSIPIDTDRFEALKEGKVHIAYDISHDNIKETEENEQFVLKSSADLSATYIGLNAKKEPYNNIKVRQAINYAVDMEAIVEEVVNGAAEIASGPLSSKVWAFNQDLNPYSYDVEKAKELLDEAGYPNGFKTSIYINDNPQRKDIARLIAKQLKEVDIDVEVKIVGWGEFLDGSANGDFDMFVLGWVTITGDPDYGLYPMFHSSQFGSAGNRNFYSNEKVDKLLDKARTEIDPEVRKEYYLEVQEIIREEAPWIFAWTNKNLDGIRNNVKGFNQHSSRIDELSEVYLEKDM